MIQNDAELTAVRRHLSELEDGLAALRREYLPGKPKVFELISRGYRSEIADLTDTVHQYLNIPTCRLPDEADIVLRITGRDAELGTFSAAAVGDCLRHFEAGIGGIAAAQNGEGSEATRAKRACKFPLTGVGPGSITLYLAAPQPEPSLFEDLDYAGRAINSMVDGIRWSSDLSWELDEPKLADAAKNVELFHVFKAVGDIVPTHRGVEAVVIHLARRANEVEPRVLEVTKETGRRAHGWAKKIAAAGIRKLETGTVRAINLDSRTFQLRSRVGSEKSLLGTFPPSLFAEFLDLLDKRVKMLGVLKSRSGKERFEVETVERL